MKLSTIIQALEELAPLSYQESYDNSGLIVGDIDQNVDRVICSLDAIESVIDEAIEKKAQLVIAHHPIVFKGLKSFTGKNYIERTVMKAIKNDIAIYAIHTNLDNIPLGVNRRIAEKLALKELEILAPKFEDEKRGNIGSGMIGTLESALIEKEFLAYVADRMQIKNIRFTSFEGTIKRVALCGGAGSFLLDQAIAQGAQVFITGDYKYHQFFDAESKIMIADIGHYESEKFTINLLQEFLEEKFTELDVKTTSVNTNPVQYFNA